MKLKPQFRFFSTKEINLDKENRTIEFSFSSELPVRRWFGDEILSHDQKAADFSRLNDGANVLFNHNPDIIVGVVEKAEIRSDKRGYAKIRFSKNAKAQEIMADVEDGIMKNVSFGYEIKELDFISENGDTKTYVSKNWSPFEVSWVSIPADFSVGVGRSESGDEKEVIVRGLEKSLEETKKVEETIIEGVKKMEQNQIDVNKLASDAVSAERKRIADISAIGEKLNQKDLARQLVESGKSLDEARGAFLETMGQKQVIISGTEGEIGLNKKEIQEFSFVKAINALMNPNDRRAQEAAKFEFEATKAAEKIAGKTSRGFMVPMDVLRAPFQANKRDLTVGTAADGGYTVATDLISGSFIDLLRNQSILDKVGITNMNGMSGNFLLPKQTGASTAYWVTEGVAATESKEAFGQVSFSPKTISAYNDYSRRLLIQSSLGVEAFVRMDLAKVIALGLDLAGLYGSGSGGEPDGLFQLSGVNTVDFAAAIPTFAELVSMETAIASDNADIGSMAYITNALGRGGLKTKVKESGQAIYLWENNQMNGIPAYASNQVATLSSTDPDIFLGVWSQMVRAMWSGLDILVDPYGQAKEGNVRVVAFQDADYGVRHAESFCYGNKTI